MKLAIDAHALESNQWAGKEHYLFKLLEALDKQPGVELFVYSRKKLAKAELLLSARCRFVSKQLPTPIWQLWLLINLKQKKIDHFLAPCTYLASALNFRRPQTVVIHDLSTWLPNIKKTHPLIPRLKEKIILALAIRNSRHVVAISKNTKKDLEKYFPSQKEKIRVIYQGLRLPAIDEYQESYVKKDPLILFVGTIEPRKNIPAVVKAFEEIKKNRPDIPWRLVLAGKIGWKADDILMLIKRSPFSRDIFLTGYIGDHILQSYYRRALCLVYPSFYEGFGLPPLEAMANGCPAIVPDRSSLPEVTGEAGIFFDNSRTISDIILRLSADRPWRQEIIIKGLRQAKKFDWDETARTFISLINGNPANRI